MKRLSKFTRASKDFADDVKTAAQGLHSIGETVEDVVAAIDGVSNPRSVVSAPPGPQRGRRLGARGTARVEQPDPPADEARARMNLQRRNDAIDIMRAIRGSR